VKWDVVFAKALMDAGLFLQNRQHVCILNIPVSSALMQLLREGRSNDAGWREKTLRAAKFFLALLMSSRPANTEKMFRSSLHSLHTFAMCAEWVGAVLHTFGFAKAQGKSADVSISVLP